MSQPFLNQALERLRTAEGRSAVSLLREVVFRAGETWLGDGPTAQELWFPEQGLLVLEQQVGAYPVEVALMGAQAGFVMPTQSDLRVRALFDGRAYALPHTQALSVCPDLLLASQQELIRQMSRWACCTQYHALPQRLACRLLLMQQSCPERTVSLAMHDLPGARLVLPAQLQRAVQDLARTGAVSLRGQQVWVQDAQALERQACACHTEEPECGELP